MKPSRYPHYRDLSEAAIDHLILHLIGPKSELELSS